MQGGCQGCKLGNRDFDIAMAFQPIVDVASRRVFAFEALVRGSAGQGAAEVLASVTPENRYAFDQRCRVAAIEGAVAAGILDTGAKLSINFLPNAVYSPTACIQLTLKTARATGFPTDRLIFEFTENEEITDTDHVKNIVETYRKMGFGTAIDDFGGTCRARSVGQVPDRLYQARYGSRPRDRDKPPPQDDRRGGRTHSAVSWHRHYRRGHRDYCRIWRAARDGRPLHPRLSASSSRLEAPACVLLTRRALLGRRLNHLELRSPSLTHLLFRRSEIPTSSRVIACTQHI